MKAEHRYVPPMNSCTHEKLDQKIAIIGGGPAGMSCAYFLAIEGYSPVVFEKEAVPGGMLVNGIPSFRIGKDVVKSEIDVLREMGVEFKCGVEVGKDITIQQLREEGYQAFYVAVGLQQAAKLNIAGEDLKGVKSGLDFLREVNAGKLKKLTGRCGRHRRRQRGHRRGARGPASDQGQREHVLPREGRRDAHRSGREATPASPTASSSTTPGRRRPSSAGAARSPASS
mgnify:CR=1 FL=1